MDPSLQPSSLAEGLQGGPRPPPVAIGAIMIGVGGNPRSPYDGSYAGCEAYWRSSRVRPKDGPHPGGGEREGAGVLLERGRLEDGGS